jgi:hypothetical protein
VAVFALAGHPGVRLRASQDATILTQAIIKMTIPSFNEAILEQVCNVLGDTSTGLTGSEIGRYLRECGIADVNPSAAKRMGLFDALVERQRSDGCANNVCAFLQRVMNPVLYVQSPDYFKSKLAELNRVLSFEGLRLTDQGKHWNMHAG